MNDTWRNTAQEYLDVAQRLWQRGLLAGNGGSLSLRVVGTSQIAVKPRGIPNIDCGPDMLLAVDMRSGDTIGGRQPSRDLGIHLSIYRACPDMGGIVLAHGPWSTAVSLLGYDELPLYSPHAKPKLRRVPLIAGASSTSQELQAAVGERLRAADVVAGLLAGRGLVTVGESLRMAGNLAELVEEAAQVALLVHLGWGGPVSR